MKMIRILLVVFLGQVLVAAQSPASIQGTVAGQGSNQPLAKVSIELQSAGGGSGVVTTTANDGRFVFRNVPPGRYRLIATRQNFVNTAYGKATRNAPGSIITVAVGQQVSGIRIEMQPTGAIYGHIYDRSGGAVTNATVYALRATYRVGGQRVLTPARTTATNDRGEYRLFWLEPGEYFVSAIPSDVNLPTGWSDPAFLRFQQSSVGYHGQLSFAGSSAIRPILPVRTTMAAPVYFPDSFVPDNATPINVAPGLDVGGIDINVFRAITGRRVSGVVVGNAGQEAELWLSSLPYVGTSRSVAVNPETGAFAITEMMPGTYMLAASSADMFGRAIVEVNETDVQNVMIRMTPGTTVSGRITFEGPVSPDARILLLPDPAMPGPGLNALLEADGAFTIAGVPSGDYFVRIFPLAENAYIKSIQFGDTLALDGKLRVLAFPTPLQVIVGNNPGTLEGRVAGNPNIAIALVPEPSHRRRFELYKSTFTDESGSFRIAGVAPGNYKVFAWTDVEPNAWQNPVFIRQFEDSGIAVRIEEGRTTTVTDVAAVPAR